MILTHNLEIRKRLNEFSLQNEWFMLLVNQYWTHKRQKEHII